MVDRRRGPTAAYFHTRPPGFHATNELSMHRSGIHERTEQIARELEVSKNPGQLLSVGQRIRELYWSALQFECGDEYLWRFDRLLGFGSFGLVASYEKHNDDGQVVDVCVMCFHALCKEAYAKQTIVAKSEPVQTNLAVNSLRIDIGKEAYHLAQLNERSSGRIIGLRGYKYLTSDLRVQDGKKFQAPPGEYFPPPLYQEWRSFLELCELGNLYGLILKYKAWGYHLPEAFIWWTFLQLMEACNSMGIDSENPFRHEGSQGFGMPRYGSFMLHHDMKEENIFVKSQPWSAELALPYCTYPLIQLADFGLSQVTEINDSSNRADRMKRGTETFFPPVSTCFTRS